MTDPQPMSTSSAGLLALAGDDEEQLAAFLVSQIDEVVRDMTSHVGDQIFDVLKRNGLLMRCEAAATVMLIEASVQILTQAADQCSRAAESDCSDAVIAVFMQLLRDRLAALRARASQEHQQ
jgi:hypothetical protein